MNMRFQLYSLACLLVTFFGTANAQNACFQSTGDMAGFSLSVETVATDVVAGLTTYRVYLNTPSTDDFVSAVIGDATDPLFLNTTTSFYQDALGGTTPAAINPLFYTMPGLENVQYDSWVTIGIEQQPDLGAGETDISLLVDPNVASWEIGFGAGGNVDISSPIGGGWYILPSSANGISGADQKVLLAQATTDGDLSGQFYIQIFPNGDQSQLIENTFGFQTVSCGSAGCTDSNACNYDDSATEDDGTCTYAAANFDCDGNCLTTPTTFTVDMSCSGETFSSVHVTGPWCGWCGAEAYNTLSDEDGDGVYSVSVCIPAGDVEYKYMIDNWASQENLIDDAQAGAACAAVTDAATYANRLTTAGSTTTDTYGSCLTCDEQAEAALGCMDDDATNYSATATTDDGSCLYNVTFQVDMSQAGLQAGDIAYVNGTFNGWCGDCNPLSDDDADGIWTATLPLAPGVVEYKFTINGWTAQEELAVGSSCDYNPNDGFANRGFELIDAPLTLALVCYNSCDACVENAGCLDSDALNYDSTALVDDASCQYNVTFQVDMSQYGLNAGDGVFLNGTYNGWCGGCNAMDDSDGDGVYTFTVALTEGLQEYKYTVNGWDASESFDGTESCTTDPAEFVNRVVDVTGTATLPVVCWNSCDICYDVNNTTAGTAHTTLQGAIDAASAGDALDVVAGITLTENITVDKGLSINGNGSTLDVSGLGVGISIASDVDGVTISNFTLVGDASTYSGITVNPGASNVSILNNDISGMALSNPANSSPLSYGILCWGNADPINPPTNILIDGNEIHGVSGTAISLGDNTESVTVSNNHFHSLTSVLVNGAPWTSGVVAGQANNLAISGNDMDGLGYASALTACTGVTLDLNQYTNGTSLILLASLPNSILPDVTDWWSLEAAAIGYIYYFNSAAAQAATDAGLQAVGIPTVLSSSNPGCMDATACNYEADALTDDGSCTFPANEHVDCAGNCLADTDDDGICDSQEIAGCTDATACNYSSSATDDNGSCYFCCADVTSSNAGYSLEQEIVAVDGVPGMTTYRYYIHTPNADDLVSAVSGDSENPTGLSTTGTFYQDELGGIFPNGINPLLFESFPSLEFDSWLTIGIDQMPDLAAGEANIGYAEADSESWTAEFEAGQDFAIDGFFGGAWYVTSDNTNGVAGADQRVLLAQLTTDGTPSGQFYVQVFPNGQADGLGELVMLTFGPHVDTTAPAFVDFPADLTLGCEEELPGTDVTVEDTCSDFTVDLQETTSGDACTTIITRTYTATDAAGNSSTATWTLTVIDDDAPVFEAPADLTVACGSDLSPATTGDVTVADDCDEYTVTYNDADLFNMDPCVGENIARTWRVADACGNESVSIQVITVVDAQAPTITAFPADTAIACDATVPASTIEAADDCGDVTISLSEETQEGECAGESTLIRTFTAADPCGNSVQHVQTIQIIDTVAPTFSSVPADVTISIYDALPTDAAEATDNCSSATILSADETDDSANDYTLVTRTFTAVDACGNAATATQTITVLQSLGCTDALACNYDAVATADDGSCDYCSCDGVYPASGPYNLDIDTIEDGIDGMTTYQVYVTLESADDFLSAVTGDSENPTYIRTSTSFHQDPLGAASAHGINGMLYDAFPPLVYDSWVTVGLTSTADPAAGEGEVTLVEGESWVSAFEAGGNIELGGAYGGGWFSLNGSSNGDAGDDLRVLIGQFTTDGVFSGQVYVQVFPNGDGDNMQFQTLRWGEPQCGCQLETACNYDPSTAYTDNDNCLYPEDLYGAAHFDCDGICLNDLDGDGVCDEDEVPGCMDDTACNFSADATDDDGTCWYADYGYECDGTCISDADFDGICDLNEVQGCNNEGACNYDPAATENDGSCTFDCYGCTDSTAANYEADALLDDGSCVFGGCTDDAASNYSATADFNDGSCEYPGCIDPLACNFDLDANVDNGSCDTTSCAGCTNDIACNYDETATLNDGSCEFFSCRGCTSADAFNYDETATVDDGSCLFGGCTDTDADNYDATVDFNDGSCEYGGCTNPLACNFYIGANVDDGSCEFTSCAGCMVTFACNYDPTATVQDDSACDFTTCCGDPAADNYEDGVADFLTYGCTYGGSAPSIEFVGCELPFACNFGDTENDCEFSSCAGCTDPAACTYMEDATISITCLYPEDFFGVDYVDCDGNCLNDANANGLCDETEVTGCTNPLACNYTDGATFDDGSCDTTSCAGCTDAAACNYDAAASINDGTCDYASCSGCTDATACNYDATATADDGGCVFPASAFVDCNGDCLNDSNANGICDEQETLGCTDLEACNFDINATFDDGSCESTSCAGCTVATACNYDATATLNDGSCDFTSCLGCLDATACNYDATATTDDGSCTYAEPEYDCDGNCLVDSDGDGICDAFDGNFEGCMDELACNYQPLADTDNGSCDYCSCAGYTTDMPEYGVEIEEYALNGIPGYTTYRIYITMPNATDQVSAVTGQTENPLYVETTGDFYQHPNGGVFPNGINPILYDFFPEIQYDSWFTIGIDAVPNTVLGQGSVQGLPEPDPWSGPFEAGNGFTIDDIIGSGWFVNPDVTNGVAGDDHKVLLAQLTTNGELSGQFYVQVFPEGSNLNQERVTLTFGGSQCGCTDETACNYSPSAIIDDESCYYPQFGYECDDVCLFDSEAPVFTETPEDMEISCTAVSMDVEYPAATDNCDTDLDFSYFDEILDGPCGETYDIVRSYVVTDNFGYADTVSHVIHVVDNAAPVFTNVPADATLECGDPLPTNLAVAVDNCNGVTITYVDEMTETGCGGTGTLVRTWSAEDACGNVNTAQTTYTIEDTTAPAIENMPADVTLSCEDEYDFPMPTASDACGTVDLTEEMTTQAGTCANEYTLIRTFTAIDACGNFSQAIQAVTVVDETAPAFSGLPADTTLECGEAIPATAVTADDLCSGAINVTFSDVETTLDACTYQVVRTFSAEDDCGNTATHDWTITFEDTTAPTFTVPADVTLDCSADITPAGAGDVTDAADACDSAPTVSHSDVVQDGLFSLNGLTADIRVELRLNNLAAFPRVLEATGVTIGDGVELDLDDQVSNPINLRGALSVDIDGDQIDLGVLDVIGSESYDYIEVRISNISGAGIVGAELVSNDLFVDASAAAFSQSFSSEEIVLSWTELTGSVLAIVNGGQGSVTALGASNCISSNIITRTWTVTDACGNSTSAQQVITLEDLTAPVFDFTPADQTLDCSDDYTLEMATATDACSGVAVTYADSESFPCDGSRVIERTFTAIDGCGNVSTHLQTISFLDTTAPVFTSTPEDLALECSEELPVTEATASDDCGSVTVTYSDETVQGDCAGDFTVLRTFTAEDGCGNSATHLQTIVFTDNTAPVVTSAPADTSYQVVAGQSIPVDLPEAEDACGTVTITFVDVCTEQGLGGYTATRTFTIADDCGNSTEVAQAITVTFALGCDDPAALNFDPEAMAGDGSCLYAGCTNPEALNYNPLADEDDGSCVVADIEGCTDPSACNYFEPANVDDGSCDYCSCVNAPVIDGYSIELETVAEDAIPGMTTYRLYVTMVNPTDVLSSVVGEDGLETYINTSTSFYQDPFGGALGQVINPILFGIQPALEYDSYVTIGLTQAPNLLAGEVEVTAVQSEDANWIEPFEAGGNITIDGSFGGAWFTLNGATNAQAGDDLRVLLGQFTTSGTLSGQISLQVFPEGDGENDLVMTFPIGNPGCGCTDESACNYVDGATSDDGSCTYTGIYDCDGETCMNDGDGDGICDELEVAGCTNPNALNYDASATDEDGTCLLLGCTDPEADNYDATANVDGECSYPMEGCTDAAAVNYDATALVDDGTCLFLGCMDPEADNYDPTANVAGFCAYPTEGCTDATAANYDENALIDDGSCLYPGCTDETALNYDPSANFDSGCILPLEGCTDPQAENYNPLANTNDGSCEYTPPCPGDLNGDGTININDLLDFFQIYGSDCPQ